MNNPKVSVIMSSYNHALYVAQAIESVVNQTYKNIELIVVDDGSKDESPQILKELQEKYGFYLECRDNYGLIATFNYMLQNLVSGKYVCFIASDDFWSLDRLEKMVSLMELNPECGLGHSDVFIVDNSNRILNAEHIARNKKSGCIFKDFIIGDYTIETPSMIVPYIIYKEVGFYNEALPIEDYQMWLLISSRYSVCYLPEKLVYYRKHETNMSGNDLKMLLAEEKIIESWIGNEQFEDIKHKVYIRFFSRFAKYDKVKAIKYLMKSLSKDVFLYKDFYKGLRRLFFYWNFKNDKL